MRNKTLLIMFIFLFALSNIALAAESELINRSFIVDKTAPLVPTLEGINDNWVNTDVKVSINNIIDPVSNGVSSGIQQVEYIVNGVKETKEDDSDFTINLTDEGIYNITAKAIDNVGNIGEEVTGEVKIDKTPPLISITGIENSKVYFSSISPEFSATDSLSGLESCTATLKKDEGAQTPFTSNSEISEQGNYILKVSATDNAGNGTTETLSFSINAPIAPVITANAISPETIKLKWNNVEGATGYLIMDNGLQIADTEELSYIHAGLNPNSEHKYTVIAYNPIGNSPVSEEVKIYTLANKPSNLHVTNKTSSTLTVAWEGDNPEGTEYSVSIAGGSYNETKEFTADMKEYTFTGLSLANIYTVKVKARNFDNIETEELTLEASTNKAPVLVITSPIEGSAFSLVEGHNTIVIKGTVTDVDNDDVTVTATINGNSKSTVVEKCQGGKEFEIIFSASEFSEGAYTLTVVADDNR